MAKTTPVTDVISPVSATAAERKVRSLVFE